jgi:multisubunit Na+/H+ antiporter MnhC subunit
VGFSEIMDSIVSFAQNYTVIAIVLALGLLFFMYRKPKLFFVILFIGLFLAGLYYMITTMAGSGSEQKKRIIQQEEKQSDSNP